MVEWQNRLGETEGWCKHFFFVFSSCLASELSSIGIGGKELLSVTINEGGIVLTAHLKYLLKTKASSTVLWLHFKPPLSPVWKRDSTGVLLTFIVRILSPCGRNYQIHCEWSLCIRFFLNLQMSSCSWIGMVLLMLTCWVPLRCDWSRSEFPSVQWS